MPFVWRGKRAGRRTRQRQWRHAKVAQELHPPPDPATTDGGRQMALDVTSDPLGEVVHATDIWVSDRRII